MTVPTSDDLMEELETVRSSGKTNMCDRRGVQAVANNLDCFTLVCWVEDHTVAEYVELMNQFGEWLKSKRTAQEPTV